MRTTDEIIHNLARLGVLERGRLLAAGVSDREIRRRIERGSLRPVHPGVYATFGTPLDYRARVLAGCQRHVVGECVEKALNERLVTVKGLRVILAELGGRGRTGTGALRTYLDRRALGDRRPESMIEPLMARLLYSDLGIGEVEYQPTLVLDGVELRPDFLVSRALTIIEVDGLDAHRSREALDHDLARQNLLVRHGFLVLRYTTTHLRRPALVTTEVVAVCRDRIAELERRPAA